MSTVRLASQSRRQVGIVDEMALADMDLTVERILVHAMLP
jgi:hypothetical protein